MAKKPIPKKELKEKILKYETFLNERLKPDLKTVLEDRDSVYSETAEFLALKNSINAIKAAELKPGEPLKTKVDLGCNFYCQARVDDPTKVFVAIGLGFFLEYSLDEALVYIDKKVATLEKKAEKLTYDSTKIKANIKLVLQGLGELQNIPMNEKKKGYRDVLS